MKLDIEKIVNTWFMDSFGYSKQLNLLSDKLKRHIKEWLRDKLKNISDESTLHNAEIVSAQNNTLYKLIKELETG